MSDLVRREALPLDERMQMARALAESSLLPRDYANNPANVLVAIDYAIGLGLDPGLALHVVDVIEGTPELKASTLGGMVRRAGHKLRVWGDDKRATCQIVRVDDPEFIYEAVWTIDMAERAGLIRPKSAWASYPADMLRNRAMKQCARMACSELFLGPVVDVPTTEPWPAETTTKVTVENVDTVTGEVRMSDKTQWQEIARLADELGIPRANLPSRIAQVIGHQIASAADLTYEEAQDVIKSLSTDLAAQADDTVEATIIEEEEHPHE